MKKTLFVISTYPVRNRIHSEGFGGVASYSKKTILALRDKWEGEIVVLADINGERGIYFEEGVKIVRCWRRGEVSTYLSLINYLKRERGDKVLLIHFEFLLYGGFLTTSFFPLFIFCLFEKELVVLLHQVVLDLNELSGHLGLRKNKLKTRTLNLLLRVYYLLICGLAGRVVVLESELADRLVAMGANRKKVVCIPHGVDCSLVKNKKNIQIGFKKEKKIVLIFGYVTWYKGTDIAIKAISRLREKLGRYDIDLIIAGGESPTQKDNPTYRDYFLQVDKAVSMSKDCVRMTGFISEAQLRFYFLSSDLIIFPYRVMMSASGPLSLALTYKKPILVSNVFKNSLLYSLDELPNYMFFEPTVSSLEKVLQNAFNEKKHLLSLRRSSEKLALSRNYDVMADRYIAVFNALQEIESKNSRLASTGLPELSPVFKAK